MDAAVRRFKAQKLYLQATAALRWINSRNAILQGHRAHAGHAPALQQIRNTLRAVSNGNSIRSGIGPFFFFFFFTKIALGAGLGHRPKS